MVGDFGQAQRSAVGQAEVRRGDKKMTTQGVSACVWAGLTQGRDFS